MQAYVWLTLSSLSYFWAFVVIVNTFSSTIFFTMISVINAVGGNFRTGLNV